MPNCIEIEELSGLDLIFYFLSALSIQTEWLGDGGLKTHNTNDFLSKKNLLIKNISDVKSLNFLLIIEKYGIEISVFVDDDNIKKYKCSRYNSRSQFICKKLDEGLMRVVVEWRYGKNIPLIKEKKFLSEKYEIPMESLGFSFGLMFLLKKSNLRSLRDICSLDKSELSVLIKNDVLLEELLEKLHKIDINID